MFNVKKIALGLCICLLAATTAFASPEAPTDAEVKAAYTNAVKVYNWFDHNTLPTDGLHKKEVGYMIYYSVNYPGIKTMGQLRQAMHAVFTPELTGMIMSMSRAYREIDNILYVAPASRGKNIFAGNTSFTIVRQAPDKINLQAKTEIYDSANPFNRKVVDYKIKDFLYTKTADGWRFATFSSID